MPTVKISNDNLSILMNKVKRTQTIGGKKKDQVSSCIIKVKNKTATVTSLVKDGLTSVSKFSAPTDDNGEGHFYITDIDTLLGVLKYHAPNLTITQEGDRLRIKSSNKQTTLMASPDALAYPHNPKTLLEWTNTSEDIASRLVHTGGVYKYKSHAGNEIEPVLSLKAHAVTLYEALRCDSMNGQKINRYRIYTSNDGYRVETGTLLKGLTTSLLAAMTSVGHPSQMNTVDGFTATFEGGLEQLLSNYNADINLLFFDFTEHRQGWKMLLDLGDGDFVFQSSVLE
jgi:hypothetical protein